MDQRVMKTLIVDDEPIARTILREELEHFHEISIVGEADNGRKALQLIRDLHPDLVFLDLQMPVLSGFEVIQNLEPPLPVIVIITAFDQHAIQAFEAGAVDYLLKPMSEGRLRKAVDRAKSLTGNPAGAANAFAKISEVSGNSSPGFGGPNSVPTRRVVGRVGEEYHLLDEDEVIAFQADRELVWIVTAKQRLLATQSLRAIESRLGEPQFQRVHRNAIVNVSHVRKIAKLSSQRWLLTLTNALQITVSKRQAHSIRQILRW
jgi:two-component system LytT family response regulator